jgi:DeoR family glycerol-3-phosphate regulon repressor
LPAPLRQQQVRLAFQRDGFVSVADLAAATGVSTMTIRRDLTRLAADGLVSRTHGGAVALTDAAGDGEAGSTLFDRRLSRNRAAKSAIARHAARLVGPALSLGLDVGTTVLAVARELAGRSDLRICTSNLRAAMTLAGLGSTVYVLGGEVRMPELSVVGASATDSLKSHYFDLVFLGASGLDSFGLYDFSPEDGDVKRAFIASAGRVVLLCDSSKFGRRALARVAGLEALDVLLCDRAPPSDLAAALAAAGVEIIVAPDAPL